MKKLETVYQIELTQTEVNALVDSLNKNYISLKNETAAQGATRTEGENLTVLRSLRDDLASLVNRRFMGIDS
jgi:hypothetical protein